MSLILVVEDETHLADGLRFNLEAEGYQVLVVDTGEKALNHLLSPNAIDLVVLDVMLPGKDGFTVVSEIRHAGQYVPTLMLTARGRADDVLRGFAAGADDYLMKPFELAILIARIRGLLRRRNWEQHGQNVLPSTKADAKVFRFGEKRDKAFDFESMELHVRDQTLNLTMMEASVLRYLIEHEGRPVSRKAMLENVWGVQENIDTRPIDNFIVRLRRYIEDDTTKPRHLITVRGMGYRFVAIPTEPGS
jgi:two-component system, OmpR family, alkaline phosphatase synthesis response regulator PhoP